MVEKELSRAKQQVDESSPQVIPALYSRRSKIALYTDEKETKKFLSR
jgi:hypothetical protein